MLNQQLLDSEYGFMKDVIFLNVSSVVMPPARVQNDYRSFMDRYVQNFGDDVVTRAWQIAANTRPKLARLIQCEPDEIAFTKNTAEGIGIIANGLGLKHGDNVVTVDQEHSSNLYAWIHLQRHGVELRIVESDQGEFTPDDIFAKVDSHTKVVALSAVQFTTGFFADLAAIGALCRQRGILFVVDGIQAVGRLNIDVQAMNIDWLAAGGNKGTLATLGVGFIYCSQRIIHRVLPLYAGYQSVVSHAAPPAITDDFEVLPWYPHARRFEAGNLNYAGVEALGNGVDLLAELGMEEIEKTVLTLEQLLRDELVGIPMTVVGAQHQKNRSGLVCVYYPADAEDKVVAILREYKIYATMRGGYIRLGINFYNTPEQMRQTAEALHKIAKLI